MAESEKMISKLCQRITEKTISNREVRIKSKVLNFMGEADSPAAWLFGLELHANNQRTSCGTCWTNCPEGAIGPRISKFIPIKKRDTHFLST